MMRLKTIAKEELRVKRVQTGVGQLLPPTPVCSPPFSPLACLIRPCSSTNCRHQLLPWLAVVSGSKLVLSVPSSALSLWAEHRGLAYGGGAAALVISASPRAEEISQWDNNGSCRERGERRQRNGRERKWGTKHSAPAFWTAACCPPLTRSAAGGHEWEGTASQLTLLPWDPCLAHPSLLLTPTQQIPITDDRSQCGSEEQEPAGKGALSQGAGGGGWRQEVLQGRQ